MKNACLMFTGQLRTFLKCSDNIFENLIKFNNEFIFDIYFLFDKKSKSKKHNYVEESRNLENIIINSFNKYNKYNKSLFIKIFISDIDYPNYCKIGPHYALYKNELLMNKIKDLNNYLKYDIFIRMRPDIIFTKPLDFNILELNNKIHIISGTNQRDCYCHNRDWDYMCVSNLKGMELYCKYHTFLKNYKKYFPNIIKFNNKSYWITKTKKTKYIDASATQSLFEHVLNNNYELVFDSGNTFLTIIR